MIGEKIGNKENVFLVLCPPTLNSFDWVAYLPEGEIRFEGGDRERAPDLSGVSPVSRLSFLPESWFSACSPLAATGRGNQNWWLYRARAEIFASLNAILTYAQSSIHAGLMESFVTPQPFHTFGLLYRATTAGIGGKSLVAAC